MGSYQRRVSIGGVVEDLTARYNGLFSAASSAPREVDSYLLFAEAARAKKELDRYVLAVEQINTLPLFRAAAAVRYLSDQNPGDVALRTLANETQAAYEIDSSPGERLNNAQTLLDEVLRSYQAAQLVPGPPITPEIQDAFTRDIQRLRNEVVVAQAAKDRADVRSKVIAAANAAKKAAADAAAKKTGKPASDTGKATGKPAADTGPTASKSVVRDLLTFAVMTSPAWLALVWLRNEK